MLEQFGEDIWVCDGPQVVASLGFHFPTRMVVVRLRDGGLWVWSPVALDGVRAAVERLGEVAHIVQPSALHDTWQDAWRTAFPKARVWRPIKDGKPEDQAWPDEIAVVVVPNRIADEAVFFHRASGTVIFCDLLQQMPPGWYSGWRGVVARLDLMVGDVPQVPRKFRLAMAPCARDAVVRILSWAPEAVVMAHGTPVRHGGTAFLRRAFRFFRLGPG